MEKAIKSLKENYILVIIIAIASILRCYKADFQSPWLDEIHTLNEANPALSWAELYKSLLVSEPHPPLYFSLLHITFMLFGYTTLVMRLFSVLIGIISLYAIYILGREIQGKKIGLFAVFIMSFNYFHLYYSQEGRPYILLVLFTTLSFYRLILYIKSPTLKNAIYYGIFSALMIYGHFFGLFALVAQYVTLLFYFLLTVKADKKRFFINSCIAGAITLVLYIPAIPLFIAASKLKDIWIPAPTLDAYTLIFKDFFGNSEMILALVGLLIFFYFLKLSKEKDFKIGYTEVVDNKNIFAFTILLPWIVIVLLIPLIRSYLSLPMLINRYFIVLLPAIILIIALGIYQFKNRLVQLSFLALFMVFSITDIFVVKNYFGKPMKSQFREASNFIIKNNKDNTPVVTSLGWYMSFYLKNDKVNFNIVDKQLDGYISEMQQDSSKIKPFWYIDAHGRPYKPSEDAQKFIDSKFYIENNFDGVDAWTKHYILLKDMPSVVNITMYKPVLQKNGDAITFNLDGYEYANNIVKVNGWAYLNNLEAYETKMDIVLIKDGIATKLMGQKVARPDVTTGQNIGFNLDDAGFSATYNTQNLAPGTYQLGIFLKNATKNKQGLVLTDKSVVKN